MSEVKSKTEKGIFYGWWIVLACAFINFYLSGVYYSGFGLFFTSFVDDFGWSYGALSLAFSLRTAETGLFAPILGFLVDRLGPRKLMVLGALISCLSAFWLSQVNSLLGFYGALLLFGLGTGPLVHAIVPMTALANWFHKGIGKASGLVVIGVGLGGFLVPALAWFLNGYGWRTSMIAIGIGFFIICTPLSLIVRHKPEQYGYLPDGKAETGIESKSGTSEARNLAEVEYTARQALKTFNFWLIFIITSLITLPIIAVMVHAIPYLESVGFSKQNAALVVTIITVTSIGGRALFGWLADVFDKRKLLAVDAALLAAGILIFAHMHSMVLLFPLLITYCFGWGGYQPLRPAILREYFGRGAFGTISGIALIGPTLGAIIGPIILGQVFDITGRYYLGWIIITLAVAMAVPLSLMIRPPGRNTKANI
ncbi:MFS transporter [Chloroflexota bacterium]